MVFKHDLVQFFDWCAHNRMDVNWSKTFIMIIKPSHMKISIPSEITCETTTISTVNNFKLLGVELSCNLDFSNFVSKICMLVNRKLYSIKRLFFLSNSVKLQFVKAFCLPYFDYCSSLCFYHTKTIVSKLHKCYYACIYRLFKITMIILFLIN
jgi:hypothetical protein